MQATGAIGGADITTLITSSATVSSAKVPAEGTFLDSLRALNVQALKVQAVPLGDQGAQTQTPLASADSAQTPVRDLSAKYLKAAGNATPTPGKDQAVSKSLDSVVSGSPKTATSSPLITNLQTTAAGPQKTAEDAGKPPVVTAATEDISEQADAKPVQATSLVPTNNLDAASLYVKVQPQVVADVTSSSAKATTVAGAGDSTASAKLAVKVHEEPHSNGTGAVIATKKNLRKEDASATDAQPAPATAEPGAAVQLPGQLSPVAAPIALANDPVDSDVAAGSDGVGVTSQAGLLKVKSSASATAKPVVRDTKKIDSADATATPQAKVETVPVVATAAAPVQPHTDSTAALRDTSSASSPSSASINGIAPAHSTHTSTLATKTSDAMEVTSASDITSQASDVKTLIATSNVLEVGIASGSHGWLRVRAELGQMGEVTASVAAASAGAAEGLHKELPAISAYLAGEQVGVSSLVVHAATGTSGALDAALNSGAGTQMGTEAGAGKKDQDAPYSKSLGQSNSDGMAESSTGLNLDFDGTNLPAVMYANGSGSWLSVRV